MKKNEEQLREKREKEKRNCTTQSLKHLNPSPYLSEPRAMQGGVVAPTKTMNVYGGDEETHKVVDNHLI